MHQSLITAPFEFEPVVMDFLHYEESRPDPLSPVRQPTTRQVARSQRPITWIRGTNACVAFIHGGKVLKWGSSFYDYYGFTRSIDDALQEAVDAAAHYSIAADSSLEVVVRASLEDKPTLGYADEMSFGRKQYFPMPEKGFLIVDGMPDDVRSYDAVPEENRRWLRTFSHDPQDIWSSRRTPEENEATCVAWRAKQKATSPKGWTMAPEPKQGMLRPM